MMTNFLMVRVNELKILEIIMKAVRARVLCNSWAHKPLYVFLVRHPLAYSCRPHSSCNRTEPAAIFSLLYMYVRARARALGYQDFCEHLFRLVSVSAFLTATHSLPARSLSFRHCMRSVLVSDGLSSLCSLSLPLLLLALVAHDRTTCTSKLKMQYIKFQHFSGAHCK